MGTILWAMPSGPYYELLLWFMILPERDFKLKPPIYELQTVVSIINLVHII